ncbi:hypothetical protein JCM10213_006477 [Rhodosporidiobolus nylandii]
MAAVSSATPTTASPASYSAASLAQHPPPQAAQTSAVDGAASGAASAGAASEAAHTTAASSGSGAAPPAQFYASSASHPPPPAPSHSSPADAPPVDDKFANPLSDAARAARSASQWNGLLKWARGARLAQGGVSGGWEWGTGMYHVPRDSPEYYSGVERAAVDSSVPRPSRPTTISSHPAGLDSDDEQEQQENLSGRPRRRGAARAGAYAEQL